MYFGGPLTNPACLHDVNFVSLYVQKQSDPVSFRIELKNGRILLANPIVVNVPAKSINPQSAMQTDDQWVRVVYPVQTTPQIDENLYFPVTLTYFSTDERIATSQGKICLKHLTFHLEDPTGL